MSLPEHGKADDQSGFTLLELLIAMTLLGLLTVILFTGLRFGARAWERGQAHIGAEEEVRLARTALRNQLSHIYPFYDDSDPIRPHVEFDGEHARMSFLAPAAHGIAPGGFMKVVLESTLKDGELQLGISERHELAKGIDQREKKADVLLRNLLSFEFSYFGSEQANQPPAWHDYWVNERTLPTLIRVLAKFPADDLRVWPELVIAPEPAADVGCVFDPITKYCRGR